MSQSIPSLSAGTTVWDCVRSLAAIWASRPAGQLPASRRTDASFRRWGKLTTATAKRFQGRLDGTLSDADRTFVRRLTDDGADLDATHAVGWGIDQATWPFFGPIWSASLALDDRGRYRPQPGDLYPVSDVPMTNIPNGFQASSRPARLTAPLADEFPHVRQHANPPGFGVIFDFGLAVDIDAVGSALSEVVTLHPNCTLADFSFPISQLVFPVTLKDPARQWGSIEALLVTAGAGRLPQLLVLPELTTDESILAALQRWLDERPAEIVMIVAGSTHVVLDGRQSNISTTLLPQVPIGRISQAKMNAFEEGLGSCGLTKEGIDTSEPELIVYAGEQFRFAVLICKDGLDAAGVAALARLGVNIIAIPAMSAKTAVFSARAGTLVADTQGFVIAANGPLEWDGEFVTPAAVFGQPILGRECVSAPPDHRLMKAPAVCSLEIGAEEVAISDEIDPAARQSP